MPESSKPPDIARRPTSRRAEAWHKGVTAGTSAASPRPTPQSETMRCERCGAEMYRMHAVWRCSACGFKTDCCGW